MTTANRIPIVLPELGSNQASFSFWYVQVWERVYEGDRVAEVLIPGASIVLSAPVDGWLAKRIVLRSDSLVTGQVLGLIQKNSEPQSEPDNTRTEYD